MRCWRPASGCARRTSPLLSGGDLAALRETMEEERSLTSALADCAEAIASETGKSGPALRDRVRATPHAAAVQEEAREELAAGRFVASARPWARTLRQRAGRHGGSGAAKWSRSARRAGRPVQAAGNRARRSAPGAAPSAPLRPSVRPRRPRSASRSTARRGRALAGRGPRGAHERRGGSRRVAYACGVRAGIKLQEAELAEREARWSCASSGARSPSRSASWSGCA